MVSVQNNTVSTTTIHVLFILLSTGNAFVPFLKYVKLQIIICNTILQYNGKISYYQNDCTAYSA